MFAAVGCDGGGKGEMFPDPAFKACVDDLVNYAIEIGNIDANDPNKYEKIDTLDCYGGGIKSLKGIENLSNLDWLAIVDNQVESLEPLRTLTKLEFLKLDNNQVKDLEPLSGLTALNALYFHYNYVEDISPLYEMKSLSTVGPGNNCIPKEQFYTLQKKNPAIVMEINLENYVIPEKCQ